MFYVDLEEDVESPAFAQVMKSLEENTDYLKVLGSY
jgi:prephenate dehydratase